MGSTLNSSKRPWFFFLCSNKLYPSLCIMNFICAVFSHLTSLCFNIQISQHYKSDRTTEVLHDFKRLSFSYFGFIILFPKFHKYILIFWRYTPALFIRNFTSQICEYTALIYNINIVQHMLVPVTF